MSTPNNSISTGEKHVAPEMTEKHRKMSTTAIPTTEAELATLRKGSPKNKHLNLPLQSEVFDL